VGHRVSLLILLLIVLAIGPLLFAQDSPAGCGIYPRTRIARFDDASKRVFVVSKLQEILTQRAAARVIKTVANEIRACRSGWRANWSASFFTDVKYVGYKTEPQLREYLEDGTWNRAYLVSSRM
jgi:hypothetical protein